MVGSESGEPALLVTHLRWMVGSRWLVGSALLAGTLVGVLWSGWSDALVWAGVAGVALLGSNGALWLLRAGRVRVPLRACGCAQLILDLAVLSVLSVWTGGLSSPFLGLVVVHAVFASLVLGPSPFLPLACAAATGGTFALGLWLSGQWPGASVDVVRALGLVGALLVAVHVARRLTSSLREYREALRRQHERTRAIIETAADGIIAIDERGVMELVNSAAAQIFGYDRAEMIGRNVRVLMPEPDRGAHDGYIGAYLRTGHAKIIGVGREVMGRRKSGDLFPMSLAIGEVIRDDRRIFTGIVRDLTEVRRTEERLGELNATLLRQREALVQHEKMAAMGTMAAGLAHEVANPLASMDSMLQLAERRGAGLGPEDLATLKSEIHRIMLIIKRVTEFAHPSGGDWETKPLGAVIESTLKMMRFDHRLRSVDLVLDLDPEVGDVRVMPLALQQVLINIITNGIDAIDGVEDARLRIGTRNDESHRVIEIEDNGPGIAAEHVDRVFEPFFTTKSLGKGTGLGLSISYSLVERHGGRLSYRSGPDGGAVFEIWLPAHGSGDGTPGVSGAPKNEKTGR